MQPTLGFQRVLQRAVFQVQSGGRKEVGVADVLVAIFSEKQSHAVYLLGKHDITRLDVTQFISHGLSRTSDDKPGREDAAGEGEREARAAAAARSRNTP